MKKLNKNEWRWFLLQLRTWYQPEHRKLPWKDIDDAYLVWVSEVFLQQTQADRVVEFFLRFTAKYPTVEHLAKADFEEALPYFRGLGFYGRLRRMLETARGVVDQCKMQNLKCKKAKFPSDIEELEKLPGIGPYTARAVASFAYGQKVLAPDTNVKRILVRFFRVIQGAGVVSPEKGSGVRRSVPKAPNPDQWVMKHLEWFDEHYPEDFNLNQVLMDFGSNVCGAAAPKCGKCPLMSRCAFGSDPVQVQELMNAKLKMQNAKREQRSVRGYKKVVVGILIQGKKVLVSRRKADQTFSGLLEFPGGKVEEGEDERRALQREFREEVGVEISVRPPFEKIVQHRKKQVLYFHRCRILIQNSKCKMQNEDSWKGEEGQEMMWMDQDQLDPKVFLPANKGIIEQLKKSRL